MWPFRKKIIIAQVKNVYKPEVVEIPPIKDAYEARYIAELKQPELIKEQERKEAEDLERALSYIRRKAEYGSVNALINFEYQPINIKNKLIKLGFNCDDQRHKSDTYTGYFLQVSW